MLYGPPNFSPRREGYILQDCLGRIRDKIRDFDAMDEQARALAVFVSPCMFSSPSPPTYWIWISQWLTNANVFFHLESPPYRVKSRPPGKRHPHLYHRHHHFPSPVLRFILLRYEYLRHPRHVNSTMGFLGFGNPADSYRSGYIIFCCQKHWNSEGHLAESSRSLASQIANCCSRLQRVRPNGNGVDPCAGYGIAVSSNRIIRSRVW